MYLLFWPKLINKYLFTKFYCFYSFLAKADLNLINKRRCPPKLLILSYAASQIAGILGNIEQLNGSNYASWKEKLEITLALLDIDYALHKDPPVEPKPEDENYEVLKKEYDEEKTKWSVSNRKCLMIIRSSIIDAIRGTIPDTQSARDYLTKIEEQFKGSSKAYATTLIKRLVGEI